jgi:hypothetical protein
VGEGFTSAVLTASGSTFGCVQPTGFAGVMVYLLGALAAVFFSGRLSSAFFFTTRGGLDSPCEFQPVIGASLEWPRSHPFHPHPRHIHPRHHHRLRRKKVEEGHCLQIQGSNLTASSCYMNDLRLHFHLRFALIESIPSAGIEGCLIRSLYSTCNFKQLLLAKQTV